MTSRNIFISTVADVVALPILTFLSPQEHLLYKTIPTNKKTPWLLGRIAAKKLYQTLDPNMPLTAIEVNNTASGAPFYKINGLSSDSYHLSISHTLSYGAAAFSTYPSLVGVDVEKIRDFVDKTTARFMTPREYSQYLETPIAKRAMVATKYWSIKEAYLKAIQTGLQIDPASIEVTFDKSHTVVSDIAHNGITSRASVYCDTCVDTHIIALVTI